MNRKYLHIIKNYPYFYNKELDIFFSSKNIFIVCQYSINHETLSFISQNILNFKLLCRENGNLISLTAIDLSKNNKFYFTDMIVMNNDYYNNLSKISDEGFIDINHFNFSNVKNYILNNLLLK